MSLQFDGSSEKLKGDGTGDSTRAHLLYDDAGDHEFDGNITYVLVVSTAVAVCGSLDSGLAMGYSSPTESAIMDDLGLSTAEYSLFASMLTVGALLGAAACGKLSDYLSRRGTMGVASVFFIIGWFSIAVSQAAWSLDLSRVFLGFSVGLNSYVVPIYIAEITPMNRRGVFSVMHLGMVCGGSSLTYIIGLLVPWRILAVLGMFPSLIELVGLFFIPESPRWLVMMGKDAEFEAALQRLRGPAANTFREAANISEYTESLGQMSKVNILQLFQKRYAYSLTVGIGLSILSEFTGLDGIIYYAISICESVGLSGTVGSIALALIQLLGTILAIFCMDRFGRKPLLMVSASGACFACTVAGLSYLLEDYGLLTGIAPYSLLIGLMIFIVAFQIGMGGIPTLLIAEIYPMNIKGYAGTIALLASSLSSLIVAYGFNFSMEWSTAGTFFMFAGACVLILLFVVILVPETKGRTLEEIQSSIN